MQSQFEEEPLDTEMEAENLKEESVIFSKESSTMQRRASLHTLFQNMSSRKFSVQTDNLSLLTRRNSVSTMNMPRSKHDRTTVCHQPKSLLTKVSKSPERDFLWSETDAKNLWFNSRGPATKTTAMRHCAVDLSRKDTKPDFSDKKISGRSLMKCSLS